MKKIILSFVLACFGMASFADEGMWLPMLIGKNIDSITAKGGRLTAEDIYSANHSSLKDAIVIFGGGCTGEIISNEGLLITNHHCGYGAIAGLSSVENNYLDDGFWAKSKKAELPVKGLSVKFLVRMQDVTDLLEKATNRKNLKKRDKAMNDIIQKIEAEASANGKYDAVVKSFFEGNQYILLVYEVFTDVRLVGTPPKSLGKFGGDTDNWMWPRHTCDFAMFRVYADSSNNPAAFDWTNVPYQPKQYLTISLKGIENNDYSMVMGFPGRTNRYETSYGIDLSLDITNPSVVNARDLRLNVMRKYMEKDKNIYLKLATEYAQIANYWKFFQGQSEQLIKRKVLADKQKNEKEFTQWAKKNYKAGADLMSDYAKTYAAYRPYAKQNVYYREAFGAAKLTRIAASANALHKELSKKKPDQKEISKAVKRMQATRTSLMESFIFSVDKEMFAKMTELYYNEISKSQQPSVYQDFIFRQFKEGTMTEIFENFANYTYSHTFLIDNAKFNQFVNNPTLEALENDPAIKYALSFVNNHSENCLPKVAKFSEDRGALAQKYIAGLMQMNEGQLFYPDANSTMRVTYGQVKGYKPQDGVYYDYYTTMDGLLAKYRPGSNEFDLPADFRELAKAGDFGAYANKDGGMTLNFISNNDITGGNSGSPVLNANGELLGLAFDGNWEAMSGDIAFDQNYKRCISVDIRYVLWVVDYYGNAKNLIAEMRFAR